MRSPRRVERELSLQINHVLVTYFALCCQTMNASFTVGISGMQHGRELGGLIFKHGGRNFLVLEDNQWEADHLFVKSVDSRRETQLLPRAVIATEVAAQRIKAL